MSKVIEYTLKDRYALTSGFGWRTYQYEGRTITEFHKGCDYGTYGVVVPVYALEEGYVNWEGAGGSAGNYLQIDYPRLGMNIRYLHLDSKSVSKGANVKKGDIIGYVGTSGQSTGIHLHLDMKPYEGDYIDPETYNYTEAVKPEPTPEPIVDILDLTKRTIRGDFGNGENRKDALGSNYDEVQKQVDLNYANGTTNWDNVKLY